MRKLVVAALALSLTGAAPSAEKLPSAKSIQVAGPVTLEIVDLSPRFHDFYQAAQGMSAEQRFKEWEARYDFAAVPPTPEGRVVARKLIDEAWPRYGAALPLIRKGPAGMQPQPADTMIKVAHLLGATEAMQIRLTTYVGGFEENAFTAAFPDGTIAVAVPLEMDPATRSRILPHEFTHALHNRLAKLSPGWDRSVGRIIFEEGLAIHAAMAVAPGSREHQYIEHKAGWFAQALPKRKAILSGLRPHLGTSDAQTVFKYTMGQGSQGLEREAYFAGWLVVGRLLEQGKTFPQLARVPEDQMPRLVEAAMAELIQ